MAHEQLPWLAPFSQQVAPGFSWRTKDTKAQRRDLKVQCFSHFLK
jgi:hypothetical protein